MLILIEFTTALIDEKKLLASISASLIVYKPSIQIVIMIMLPDNEKSNEALEMRTNLNETESRFYYIKWENECAVDTFQFWIIRFLYGMKEKGEKRV